MKKKHIGGKFDEFLKDESILEHCTATATDRILAWKTERGTGEQAKTKIPTTKTITIISNAQKSKGIRNP